MTTDELITALREYANADEMPLRLVREALSEAALKLEALTSARKKALADAGIQKSDVTPKSYITTTDIMPCEPPPPPPKKKKQKGKKKHGKRCR